MSLDDSVEKIPGIGSTTKKKLINAGIIYIKDVLMFSPARLAELTGISEETAEKVIKNAIKYLEKKEMSFGFIEASKIEDKISCLLYTSPSPRDLSTSRMPSSA